MFTMITFCQNVYQPNVTVQPISILDETRAEQAEDRKFQTIPFAERLIAKAENRLFLRLFG